MSGIPFFSAQLSVKFTNRNMRITAMEVANPLKFLLSVSVRMRGFWPVRFIKQGFLGSIEFFVPTH